MTDHTLVVTLCTLERLENIAWLSSSHMTNRQAALLLDRLIRADLDKSGVQNVCDVCAGVPEAGVPGGCRAGPAHDQILLHHLQVPSTLSPNPLTQPSHPYFMH